ncbi:hypothetical protein AGMMS49949_08070 [Alphaproteobacteria bacterium]|nr:hypothetical protein AGMMS49949_08070 [Alphaproteobacteria bacterium]
MRGKDFFDPERFQVDYFLEDQDIFLKLKGKKYKVLQINAIPVEDLLKKAKALLPCENVYGFRFGVKNFLMHPTSCKLLGMDMKDGQQIKFLEGDKVRAILIKPTENKNCNQDETFVSYKIDKKNNYGVFTLTHCCFNDIYKQTLQTFFKDVKRHKIATIAIDLRENQGGNSNVMDEFFKYLPCDTYNAPSMFVREGKDIHSFKNQNIKNVRYASLTYHGKIFVLTSPKTFSSATAFSVCLQDNHFAKIVGEPSGNSPSCYRDVVQTNLPNPSLCLMTTYKKFVRPDESKKDEPAQHVDHPCEAAEALEMLEKMMQDKDDDDATCFSAKKNPRGRIIVFDGPDGCGKSTQITKVAEKLSRSHSVVVTRQPGGTELGTRIRKIVLDGGTKLSARELALLFSLDRSIHLADIKQRMEEGNIVLIDRFQLSTLVYQGCCSPVPLKELDTLYSFIVGDFKPDLTLVFNLPFSQAQAWRRERARQQASSGATVVVDRFEGKEEFLKKVHEGYEKLSSNPHYKKLFNIQTIDCVKQDGTEKTEEEMTEEVMVAVSPVLLNRG